MPSVHATVQAAVDAIADGGFVCLEDGTHAATVNAGNKSFTLQGAGPDAAVLDGGSAGTVLLLGTGAVTIEGVTIRNGSGTEGGGINLNSSGTLTINDSTISGNSAASGGGIFLSR